MRVDSVPHIGQHEKYNQAGWGLVYQCIVSFSEDFTIYYGHRMMIRRRHMYIMLVP